MNNFFKENRQLVFQAWLSPDEVKELKILDLGCQFGWFGEYCINHQVKEYIGVDIDESAITQARIYYPELTFVHSDLEDYLKECVENNIFFDTVVISRTIEGIHNQVTVLQNVSKIAKSVVLEIGVPLSPVAYKLLKFIRTFSLSDEEKLELDKTKDHIEYDQPFVEYFNDNNFVWAIPSIGFYKTIMSNLGFQINLDTYEKMKQQFPTEYGYFLKDNDGSGGTADKQIGKAILKFTKISNNQIPLTWKEWYDSEINEIHR